MSYWDVYYTFLLNVYLNFPVIETRSSFSFSVLSRFGLYRDSFSLFFLGTVSILTLSGLVFAFLSWYCLDSASIATKFQSLPSLVSIIVFDKNPTKKQRPLIKIRRHCFFPKPILELRILLSLVDQQPDKFEFVLQHLIALLIH